MSGSIAEVEIQGDDHSILGIRFDENLAIRKLLQAFIPEVNRVMALVAKPFADAHIDARIDEKPHQTRMTSSLASHAAYSMASRTSSSLRSG